MSTEEHLPLFVYGTLMPGQVAYERLAANVRHELPARLDGATLHAFSWYPMAAQGEGTVFGVLLWLAAEPYAALLQALDEYESDAYSRVVRTVYSVEDGAAHRAYVYLVDPTTAAPYPHIASGDWRTYRQTGDDG